MGLDNQISVRISPEDMTLLNEYLSKSAEILHKYTVEMSAKDRQRKDKFGDKASVYVGKCIAFAKTNPEFIPGFMELEELEKDYDLTKQMSSLIIKVKQIRDSLTATRAIAGFEANRQGNLYYHTVKAAMKMGVTNAITIYNALKFRFAGMGKRPKAKPQS